VNDWATKAYSAIIESGNDWADKESAASLLEHSRHTILAQEKLKSGASSDAASETIARASQNYVDHVSAMVSARSEANKARVKWEASKTLASLRQTQESLKKAEMNLR
jgi:hypothetical protein